MADKEMKGCKFNVGYAFVVGVFLGCTIIALPIISMREAQIELELYKAYSKGK